ncbi:MAG: hypothetical protein U0793_00540 [Gemmataceae bacterium]
MPRPAGFVEPTVLLRLWRHRCRTSWLSFTSPALATLHYLGHEAPRAYPWRTLAGLCGGIARMVTPRQSRVA